ncbi:hypothetical protein PENANT_c031G04972 [Penicillium antarcticum]|uniref:Vacuolar ATPase assembly protein VMA22 n=1 Tax=Penicillium antarcticum TaxID=416450 RepID=A0A1V6PVD4_9EURO|nr:uncharacterized protein N7508_005576 [Penicillium antarcticum]KAJ5306561.1 hypothetical protein N7508_005576 [Penicillium antarcticum]OQD80925.1 hypothetical protein PENANT_c031G04972 [Penicillium antarcticum]
MTQIPTPPASRPGSEAPEAKAKPVASELVQSLDTLLEQYLNLLDKQQKLQTGLAEQLSSGFFSLAQANFSCPPGRRYGPDFYDERMKATRKISIKPEENIADESANDPENKSAASLPSGYNFTIESTSSHEGEAGIDEKSKDETSDSVKHVQSGTEDTTVDSETTPETPESSADGSATTGREKPKLRRKKFHSDDPIHWYGILVPQSLRTAQHSFAHAVDTAVPELASTTFEMRILEEKIGNLRAQLVPALLEESHDLVQRGTK